MDAGSLAGSVLFLMICAAAVVCILHKSRSVRVKAWELVQADADAYETTWQQVLSSHRKVIEGIADTATYMQKEITTLSYLSRWRRWSKTSDGGKDSLRVAPVPRSSRTQDVQKLLFDPTRRSNVQQLLPTLPLLYAQAWALNDYFQKKCASWAAGHGEHTVAEVKRQDRAIQKLWRTYKGDPRLLLDLVRSSIVCETPTDILHVLEALDKDPAVGIVRIKNRMSSHHDASESGGFRNISINLVVVDDQTCRLCTASHICELQLQLKSIYTLRSDGGHKRFVAFRNMRAE